MEWVDGRLTRLRHDPLLVRLDVPRERLHAAIVTHPQARAHVLQHGHVVTDHEDASLELFQRAREGVHGLDVEVVRRFVQDEYVRVRQAQAGKRHAGLLAPGQQGHFLQAGGARDAEGAQVASVLLVLFAGVVLRHEADGAGVHVQGVDVVLGEETDPEPGVLRYEADRGLELADEEFEDGCFAGAVGADDADAGVELDV